LSRNRGFVNFYVAGEFPDLLLFVGEDSFSEDDIISFNGVAVETQLSGYLSSGQFKTKTA
jgi:hypothetical protein